MGLLGTSDGPEGGVDLGASRGRRDPLEDERVGVKRVECLVKMVGGGGELEGEDAVEGVLGQREAVSEG